MSRQVGVGLGPDKRPVAVKRVYSPTAAARLANEVRMLQAARHPGVVTVTGYQPGGDDGRAVLTTAWVPGGSLAAAAPRRTLPALVPTLASAAATVADLHDRRIVHGRLGPEHVLVDGDGAAILTGFADAEHHGSRPATDDVAALGRLITDSVTLAGSDGRGWRSWPPRRRRRCDELAERLTRIGARAADPMPTRRPSARALVRQLAELVPPDAAPRRRARRGVTVVVAVVLAAAVGGVALATSGSTRDVAGTATDGVPGGVPAASGPIATEVLLSEPSPAPTEMPDTSPVTTTGALPSAATSTVGPTESTCAPSTAAVTVDLDGDGCGEAVVTGADGAVRVGELEFQLGLDGGDAVVVGDWDCDGVPTLAIVHRPSGAVDVFDTWPAAGGPPAAARRVGVVAGATTAEARRNGGPPACDDLVVAAEDGTSSVVATT